LGKIVEKIVAKLEVVQIGENSSSAAGVNCSAPFGQKRYGRLALGQLALG
jgi:hypothetical protein